MGNRHASKCQHCKKALPGGKIDQKYCSNACRQAAHRKRQAKGKARKQPEIKPLNQVTCAHCGGGFFAKTSRATYCSTSCRTLAHRAMKSAMPAALGTIWHIPEDKALDLLETQPLAEIKRLLACMGYTYWHERRAWLPA